MTIETDVQTQIDFSGGQVNKSALSRDDIPAVATGGLQFDNFRAEAQGTALSRPGRDALYPGSLRTEIVRMEEGFFYHVSFYQGEIVITDPLGNSAASSASASYLWTDATVDQVSVAYGNYQVCVCFPGMQPVTITWNPSSQAWTFAAFAWTQQTGNIQEPFFRQSILGAKMFWDASQPYNTIGSSIALNCDTAYFTAQMAGSVLSILGGQVVITSVTNNLLATVTVLSPLPDALSFTSIDTSGYVVGQIAETTLTGYLIEIDGITPPSVSGPLVNLRSVELVPSVTADTLTTVSASHKFTYITVSKVTSGNVKTVQWLEEFMSSFQGWPAAVSFGNDRFIFSQFPQRQEAILWTEVGQLTSCYIDSLAAVENAAAGALPTSGILEFMDGKPKVLNVIDTGDEFVFTDKGVFFIPLAVSGTALKPGSVAFRQITDDGCSAVKPVEILQTILYANAAGNRISAVRATGSLTLPYTSDDLTDVHSNLFNAPRVIAVSSGDASPDRLVYVVNGDKTLVVGKFATRTGAVGWHPESGLAPTSWVLTDAQDVWYNSVYPSGVIVEHESTANYLDSQISLASPPANLAPSPGMGVFWWLAGQTVTLAQNGVDLGDRQIDALGNIVYLAHENPANYTALVAGTPVFKAWQPVIKKAAPGQSRGQRMRRRNIKNALIKIESNAEFDWGSRRVPAYQFNTDQTLPPPFSLKTIRTGTLGRSYDPAITLTSTRFGKIRLIEFSAEVTV